MGGVKRVFQGIFLMILFYAPSGVDAGEVLTLQTNTPTVLTTPAKVTPTPKMRRPVAKSIAVLSYLYGEMTVTSKHKDGVKQVRTGDMFYPGDIIEAQSVSRAAVVLTNGFLVPFSQAMKLVFISGPKRDDVNKTDQEIVIGLISGKIVVVVGDLTDSRIPLRIKTKAGDIRVTNKSWGRIGISADGTVSVSKGSVWVENFLGREEIGEGMGLQLDPEKAPSEPKPLQEQR